MRILHLSPFFRPDVGGMETFSSHLVAALQARGYQNLVIASHKSGTLRDVSQAVGVPVHRVHYMQPLYRHDLKTVLRSRKKVERIWEDFRPDVAVLHIGGMLALLQRATAVTASTPLVAIAYDLAPVGTPSPTLKQLFDRARRTVAISKARLQDARFIAPDSADRMSLIYPCIPWRALHPNVERSAFPLVLMAGRMDPAKGFDLAVESFRMVLGQVPDARLVLVGDGPMVPAVRELVRRLGLDGSVRLTGHLPEAELTRLYQQAWLSLVPSRHSESFGLVALEAMQAACPVIASDTGGLAEIVLDGETGFLVPVDDAQALAQRMLKLLQDGDLRARMGSAGQARARAEFDWETCIASYDDVLLQAASERQPGSP